jgi:nucleoside-diphosphate-sugar epimerase
MEADQVFVVTGGLSDFLGKKIAESLAGAGHEVIIVDNEAVRSSAVLPENAERINLGIGNEELNECLAGLEKRISVIHCRTRSHQQKDVLKNGEENLIEQLAFLKCCQRLQVRKITLCLNAELLFADPMELPVTEFDRESPKTLAGVNQLVVESHLPLLGLPWVSTHASTLYGPGQRDGLVPKIFSILERDKPLDVFQPEICTKDFIYIDDAAAGIIAAADAGAGIYNISSGKETHLIALMKLMRKICASKSSISENRTRDFFYQRSCFSPTKAQQDLGWQTVVSLKNGITDTASWIQNNLP